jgi:hypothetical protein
MAMKSLVIVSYWALGEWAENVVPSEGREKES